MTDEALTGFLSIYNPTVIALRRELGFWPMPTFEFRFWLLGLIAAILVGIAVTPLFFRNVGWIRPVGYFVALFAGIFNALGHTIATILGHTVRAVTFKGPAPGFYSSPLLFVAACYLIVQLRRAKTREEH